MNSEGLDANDEALAQPFDKKVLQQHRNSADSEFNNKGHRKLRPASKTNSGHASGNALANEKAKGKMLLTECLADGTNPGILAAGALQEQQSSNSLDELEFHRTQEEGRDGAPGAVAPNGQAGHRRAKSSIGMNRKASGKHKDSSKLPPGPLVQNPLSNGKKSSSSQNRGATLAQIREKNSSSAMAQLQPRSSESGPKIPMHVENEDMLDDMMQNNSTYLSNHQS